MEIDLNSTPHAPPSDIARPHGLSIVLPVYNEEGLVGDTIEHLLAAARRMEMPTEIIVVNDGSVDCTHEIIHAAAAAAPEVNAYDMDRNRGFGGAVRFGITRARYALVIFCPADYLMTQQDFDSYLALIRHCDVVIGYRRVRRLALPLYPRLVSSIYHVCVNLLFRLNFFDVNWIHTYRTDAILSCLGQSDGVFFLAETLINAKRAGLNIVGVDVRFVDRDIGVASGLRSKTILRTLRDMFRFRLRSPGNGHPS